MFTLFFTISDVDRSEIISDFCRNSFRRGKENLQYFTVDVTNLDKIAKSTRKTEEIWQIFWCNISLYDIPNLR